MPNTRILIVDDSSPIRQAVASLLGEEADLQVVGIAPNGRIGVEKATQVKPDVVLLDIEMPEMDGMEALKLIRKQHPKLPVIMFSALTKKGASQTLDALALGADDYVAKPSMAANLEQALENCKGELVEKIRALCSGRNIEKKVSAPVAVLPAVQLTGRVEVVVIAASTGGPNALSELLPKFPAKCPVPIVVVQSMLPMLIKSFAERLQTECKMKVVETGEPQPLKAGHIYIATGGKHTVVTRNGALVEILTNDEPPDNSFRPSVDLLLRSVAGVFGGRSLVAVLTGMGNNGLKGCLLVRNCGAEILVQDRESSKLWGMPAAVVEAGIAHGVYPLNQMQDQMCKRILASKSTPVLALP